MAVVFPLMSHPSVPASDKHSDLPSWRQT